MSRKPARFGAIDAALAAAAKRSSSRSMTPAQSQWQPIETAPTDRPILVFDPAQKAVRVVERMTAPEDGSSAWIYAKCMAWETELATGISFEVRDPSHWQPLPEPPESA